ncbi:NAD(P)/FAD-dependent oxidoreductase [Acinetobacter indicus]|uniref:NAD(P)/FAD-dependent oxidoreductase n=1 Tax=Acinetobacter indicus TaxID=756892 RepID=UPI001443B689|nr:FAD-dependent oxidoreductase [Acinetobacter indicus]MCO8107325.1 FAD-dependent oxidoreductase [Acinetobacter indicus]MDM1263410.1 FAD-dependent oxidoreductase [Acinetobacter indicus]
MNKIVIVGAGQAAGWAVHTLRNHGYDGEIHVVSNEDNVFYERPPLSKQVLSQEAPVESLNLFPENQVDEFSVIWHKPDLAVKIDKQDKCVHLQSGKTLAFDKLLIATGSRARIPIAQWANFKNVYTLRDIQDCHSLAEQFKTAENIAVIGGGWIGLEIAATARKQGKNVEIFECGSRLCARSVSPEVSAFLKDLHEEAGTKIHLNAMELSLSEVDQDKIQIDAGPLGQITFDCVVVGAGAEISKELAVDAELDVKDGIVVNEYGQSSHADIYAAGDVAIHPGLGYCIQSWANAQNQAISAAKSMLGDLTAYQDIPWLWSDQYQCNIQILGTYQPEKTVQVVIRKTHPTQQSFFYLDDQHRLINMIAVNEAKLVKLAKRWLANATQLDPQQLQDLDFNLMKLK